MLTRDKPNRYRVPERTALQEAGVKAFVFTGGNVSLADTVRILIRALGRICQIVRDEPAPFIYHIGGSGRPARMD